MAMKHYEGKLGVFDYDDDEFELGRIRQDAAGVHANIPEVVSFGKEEFLLYKGKETDGSKVHIPEGIIDCNHMFLYGHLETAPDIPNGVKYCDFMFEDCKSLKTAPDIPGSVNNCTCMFEGCTSLEVAPELSDNIEDCRGMFARCESLKTASKIPDNIKDCTCMFEGCTSLETAPKIPGSVENCVYMFYGCQSLREAPEIPDSVKDCRIMFRDCKSLETAPEISDGVKYCKGMFQGCASLKTAPSRIPNSVENCDFMFSDCISLEELPKAPKGTIGYHEYIMYPRPRKEHKDTNKKNKYITATFNDDIDAKVDNKDETELASGSKIKSESKSVSDIEIITENTGVDDEQYS